MLVNYEDEGFNVGDGEGGWVGGSGRGGGGGDESSIDWPGCLAWLLQDRLGAGGRLVH